VKRKAATQADGEGAVAVGNDNYGTILTGPITVQPPAEAPKHDWEPRSTLPPEVPDFTGREYEIQSITQAVANAGSLAVLISGKPGVGKTTLALHIAYLLRERFQDGALYADLRGIAKEPTAPEDIMRRFLSGVGVPKDEVPVDHDLLLDRYRGEFADRKIVMILDNAGSESQIRSLVPPGSRALILVTSRYQLSGLESIQPLTLDVFDKTSSLALLCKIAGDNIVDGDIASSRRVVDLCGHLPLALRIAGNRLRHVEMRSLAGELLDQQYRLDALETGDLAVRTAFNLSYRKLGKRGKNTLKRLSCVPGEDFGAGLCGALSDMDNRHAKMVLRDLAESNLIELSARPGRYRFHDLVKAYARGKFAKDPEQKQRVAMDRMLDWLSYSALRANFTLTGQIGRAKLPDIRMAEIDSIASAAEWMKDEVDNGIASISLLAERGAGDRAKSCAVQLVFACEVVGDWQAWGRAIEQGLRAVEDYPDSLTEITMLVSKANLLRFQRDFKAALDMAECIYSKSLATRNKELIANAAKLLGCLKIEVGEQEGALSLLEESLNLNRELGLTHEVGKALYNLGTVHRASGRTEEAIRHFEKDLQICLEANDLPGAAETMNTLALTHMEIGEFSQAEIYQYDALKIFQQIDNPHKVSMVCNDLAISLRHQGKTDEAIDLHYEDIERCKECGNKSGEALAKVNAAVLLVELDRDAEAEPLFEEGVSFFGGIGDGLRLARTLVGQISMLFKAGKVDLAVKGTVRAIELLMSRGEVRDAVSAHQVLAHEFIEIDAFERALFHAEQALSLGEGVAAPYLKAASCIAAISACQELGDEDAEIRYVKLLRDITNDYPELVAHLSKRLGFRLSPRAE
jgi:tetratricopeptide (TPR) repeat protein